MLSHLNHQLKKIPVLKKLKRYLLSKLRSSTLQPSLPISGKYPRSWPTLQLTIKKYATETGVMSNIHDIDYIFRFLLEMMPSSEAVASYFQDGANSGKKLSKILEELKIERTSKTALLEFASGYGMVTRHLLKELSPIRIVSCDIHQQAIDFLHSTLGVETILSKSVPEEIKWQDSYDVVFALSFFSHMPDHSFGRWLKTLFDALKPNGYLIFTTHGISSTKLKNLTIPAEKGFLFVPMSEQKDLNENEYGSSYVTSKYVKQQVKHYLHADILSLTEAAWWNHQDLYIIRKT